MDTEGVRLFVLAAEKLNISAAGRELGMAPAVASAKLAKLENTLQADLLHRSTRKVALSLKGEEFLPYAKEILAQEDTAVAALGLRDAKVTGTLRFAAPSTFAQMYIAPILQDFIAQYPGIKLDLRLSDTPFDLINGSFDLALRNSVPSDTSFKGRKLADDMRILCASPKYLEKYGAPKHLDDLNDHRLISFQNLSVRNLIGRNGEVGIFNPKKAENHLIIDDGQSQKVATLAGVGISINSLWSVHDEIANGTLIRILPDYEADKNSMLWLVYPQSNILTAKVRVFIDFLVEKIGKPPVWTDS